MRLLTAVVDTKIRRSTFEFSNRVTDISSDSCIVFVLYYLTIDCLLVL